MLNGHVKGYRKTQEYKILVKAVKSKPNELRHFKVDPVVGENLMRLFIILG